VIDYPSIPRAIGQAFREIPNAYIFDKLDGTSHRSEWSRKRGWYKHGLRHTRNDENNALSFFAEVPGLFEARLAEPLARIFHDLRWTSGTIFYEYWGSKSLAGFHVEGDHKFLTPFDVAGPDDEILSPGDFRKNFEDKVPIARFLGRVNWTRGYVDLVRSGQVEVTSEGVVAKLWTRKETIRAKAKAQTWIDRVMAQHGETEGRKLVES
jgi:hypothetical protein